MHTSVKKICIVTTRHISYNPRVLKEADAFQKAGYVVTVVTINNHPVQYNFDRQLMNGRKWRLKTVNFRKEEKSERTYWLYLSLKQKFFTLLSGLTFRFGIAERAAFKAHKELAKLASSEKADFYLAHHAEALGPACTAANRNRSLFGFDAEDFHTGMNESEDHNKENALIDFLEKKYLPLCSYITAASKGIGKAYQGKYGVSVNSTILNVFPAEIITNNKLNDPVRFYWYSQVIGPNRSLETLIEAASYINGSFEIHLRGSFQSEAYKEKLLLLIEAAGLKGRFFFHPPILSEEIIRDGAQFDIGLALESGVSLNRNICVTNKIFSYLMSGLAIVGTDTDGQKDIFGEFEEAISLCRQNDAADLARAMSRFLYDKPGLAAARHAARQAAIQRYNWEVEADKLLSAFKSSTKQRVKIPLGSS